MFDRLIGGFLDIIYPKVCLNCKDNLKNNSIDNLVCEKCWGRIKFNVPPFCRKCGRHSEATGLENGTCSSCSNQILHFDRAFSPCIYEGVIKTLLHLFKYDGKDYLGATLSRLMSEFIKEYNLDMASVDLIVPMPLHKTRLREREFNQAQILSKYIAEDYKTRLARDLLTRNRNTETQTELKADQRSQNVRGSFSVVKKSGVAGNNIMLIDDVLTTGATSSEAALALKEAGAKKVLVLTLAS